MFSKLFSLFLLLYSFAHGQILENINSYYGDKWNGLIPHLQPFNTSDYYGSGDVNCDTWVDSKDLAAIQLILTGESNSNIRADVDGDHSVTEADLQMLNGAINGDTLPAWWNLYNIRNKKIDWLKLMLKIDKTDEHPYLPGEYECPHFALQLFKTFTGMNEFSGVENTFQTKFNLPIYYVFINPPSQIAHNLNAILIGEDPLNFSDWLFIEPQNDALLTLNHYPAGTQISIMSFQNSPIVIFELNSNNEGVLNFYNKSLVTSKPVNTPDIVSQPYISNLYIIENNKIIFEKVTDDMERKGKLHIAALDNFNSCFAKPLTMNSSSIILVQSSQTGGTDLIWEESLNDSVYDYFYGNYNYEKDELENIQKLPFLNGYNFYKLKVYVDASKGYMIWLSSSPNTMYKYFYSEMVDGIWQNPEIIEMGKSNYPTDYDFGMCEDGKFYLFSVLNYWNSSKVIIYSSANNWEVPEIKEYIAGNKVIFINKYFFVFETEAANLSNIIGVFSKPEESWNISYSYFTGIPFQLLDNKDQNNCYYISGYTQIRKDKLMCAARMQNLKTTEHYIYYDYTIGLNFRMNAKVLNNELIISWQDGPSKGLNIIKQNLETSDINIKPESAGSFLNQNYPNPFNSETIIKYELDKSGNVDLIIYDILGREIINILDNEWQTAGEHTISFDGRGLSSGIYLYKLTTGTELYVKTMTLVK